MKPDRRPDAGDVVMVLVILMWIVIILDASGVLQ